MSNTSNTSNEGNLACVSVEHNHVSCMVAAIAEGFPREKFCEPCETYYYERNHPYGSNPGTGYFDDW